MKGSPFTPKEAEEIKNLVLAGVDRTAIAERMDRSYSSITTMVSKLRKGGGLAPRPRLKPVASASGPVANIPSLTLRDDDKLVALCRAAGGFPRAVVHSGRTFWIDFQGKPWRVVQDLRSRKRAA